MPKVAAVTQPKAANRPKAAMQRRAASRRQVDIKSKATAKVITKARTQKRAALWFKPIARFFLVPISG